MALALLGDTLDLHCGGVDLIFPHHEDEIAQSEGSTGVTFSRRWCHGEFLLTDGAKMAKRVGNVMAVADLRAARISGAALRHLMYTTHYRQVLNLSEEALEASQRAVAHVGAFAERVAAPGARGGTPAMATIADEFAERVRAALFDDLNAPQALAAVFDFLRAANADLDKRGNAQGALERARGAVAFIEATLGIVPPPRAGGVVGGTDGVAATGVGAAGAIPETAEDLVFRQYVEERLRVRREARSRRDFRAADAIRDELASRGVSIADSGDGTSWKKIG
jgi:cysteinyl-tRNA synthetase